MLLSSAYLDVSAVRSCKAPAFELTLSNPKVVLFRRGIQPVSFRETLLEDPRPARRTSDRNSSIYTRDTQEKGRAIKSTARHSTIPVNYNNRKIYYFPGKYIIYLSYSKSSLDWKITQTGGGNLSYARDAEVSFENHQDQNEKERVHWSA